MTIDEVRSLLQQFQDGYSARDVSKVDQFMELFGPDESLEVIGTGGVTPGKDEWCRGRSQVRELVQGDWEGWGDLRLDVPGAQIFARGEVAWLATIGTVSMDIPAERSYQGFQKYIDWIRKQENLDDKAKMLEIVRFGGISLTNLHQGDHYVWPIRFTALAVKDGETWRFYQMTFSFPTTVAPDVRY